MSSQLARFKTRAIREFAVREYLTPKRSIATQYGNTSPEPTTERVKVEKLNDPGNHAC